MNTSLFMCVRACVCLCLLIIVRIEFGQVNYFKGGLRYFIKCSPHSIVCRRNSQLFIDKVCIKNFAKLLKSVQFSCTVEHNVTMWPLLLLLFFGEVHARDSRVLSTHLLATPPLYHEFLMFNVPLVIEWIVDSVSKLLSLLLFKCARIY